MAAVLGSATAFATLGGRADPAAFPAPMQQKPEFSDADRAAFLEARIAALHAGLKLSPEQERLWPAVETALRSAGKSAMDRYQKFKTSPQTETSLTVSGGAAKTQWRGAKILRQSQMRLRRFMPH